jgi:two-component system, cell cycle sensor histidine kinase and response regulator CckA
MEIILLLTILFFIASLVFIFFSIKKIKTVKKFLQFKYLFENSKDYLIFSFRFFPVEKFDYISPSSIYINGYTPEEHYKNPDLLKNLVFLDDFPVFEFWKNFPTLSNKPIIMRWVRKDGKIIWTEHRYSSVVKNNRIVKVIGVIKDITEQKEIEFSLRESEEKYHTLFENADDFIFLIDYKENFEECEIIEINDIAKKKFCPENCQDNVFKIANIISPDRYEIFKEKIKIIKEKKTLSFETIFIDNYSYKLNIDLNMSIFKYKNKKLILIIARDITEKRKIEIELQKNQKIEALSVLSGGLAHDFNNLLTAILGNLSLIRLDNKDIELQKSIENIENVIYKAKNLTGQLLSFSKSNISDKKIGDISHLIKESAIFVTTGSNIKCEFQIDNDLKHVEFDETQMTQVVHNLVINSMQSMENGGKINISLKNTFLSTHPILKDGEYLQIKISDTGYGISKENLLKIFDPFFTTKSKGTGLGLTSSFSIIKHHGGNIDVDSELGKGTTFTIYLPVSNEKDANQIEKNFTSIKKGNGKILVMDDTPEITDVTKKIIEYLGYTAEISNNSQDTINKYIDAKNKKEPFDLLILDATIQGGTGGKDTMSELLKINPEVKVILSTGLITDTISSSYNSFGFCDVIIKPFSVETISNMLYKHIDKK